MSDTIFMHDAPVKAFDSVSQDGVTVDDDGEAEFEWDEVPIVSVDAPADLEGAFDTRRFFKIEDATIARPIKQVYHVGDDVETYKKPADELRQAAWSFDNAPFTLDHPSTGMVKDVNDVHGFWKNPRYVDNEDRLNADLYIPATDDEAKAFVAENQDVSVGFFNRVYRDYDGDTGDLTDEEGVDGYQVDIYGNHVAGVERGRCSSEEGCGLDSVHGRAIMVSEPPTHDGGTTSFLTKEDQTKHEDDDIEDRHMARQTSDQPSGIKSHDGEWFAVGPNEHSKDSTDHPGDHMFPVGGCADIEDAWNLRGSAEDLEISEETLANRIIRAAEAQDCDNMPSTMEEQMDADCGCGDNTDNSTTIMTDDPDFDLPDLSVDALAEKHEGVRELKEQYDEYKEAIDDLRDELDLEEDECPCDVVPDLKEDAERASDLEEDLDDIKDSLGLDEDADVTERVEDIADEWQEMREDKREERLDTLEDLGAERDEWEDETLDALDEEIERREEVLDAVDETSPTAFEDSEGGESGGDDGDVEKTISGRRTFGRGHAAR